MRGPSQSTAGKYRAHKNRGPTLNTKAKGNNSKAKRDENRRRTEKAKTEHEVKIDALQTVIDSLKADGGELKDKLRSEQNLSLVREKYLAQLELRFSQLCEQCKTRTPDTAFSSQENYALTKITKMLEEQKKELDEMKIRIGAGALRAPDDGEPANMGAGEKEKDDGDINSDL